MATNFNHLRLTNKVFGHYDQKVVELCFENCLYCWVSNVFSKCEWVIQLTFSFLFELHIYGIRSKQLITLIFQVSQAFVRFLQITNGCTHETIR